MRVLIVGYGSIGKRHYEILQSFAKVAFISIVSKQDINDISSYKSLNEVENISSYDYFIIASETSKHYEQLSYLCSQVHNKKILVEKPLFDKKYGTIECDNELFTAYNLRFHPVIQKLKELLENKSVYYANVICGQYLPTWRPDQDYRKSYSANLSQGGGVLRDLSHELDYMSLLFGKIDTIDAINTKVSDLEINSDDIFTAIAVTENRSILNITMDYISKVPLRRIIIHTQENKLNIYDKNGHSKMFEIEELDRNHTYCKMHESILSDDTTSVCSFLEGESIVDIIETIEFKEL